MNEVNGTTLPWFPNSSTSLVPKLQFGKPLVQEAPASGRLQRDSFTLIGYNTAAGHGNPENRIRDDVVPHAITI